MVDRYFCFLNLLYRLGKLKNMSIDAKYYQNSYIPYIGNFSRREILTKLPLGRCVKFSMSPIFAISRALNEDV